jgi:HAD superfamily hydrolase (TIGR01458 family)
MNRHELAHRNKPSGLLIDLEGTVWDGDALIHGADQAVNALREAGVPFRFVTNTTRVPRGTIARWLADFGIPATADEVFTPALAAANWLKDRQIRRVFICLPPHTFEEFPDFIFDEQVPEAVVIGDMGDGWTIEIMNTAFRLLLAGAEFVALHKNRYWKTGRGLCLDAGAFVAALEYATGRTATLVGKPSRPLFEAAARSMGLSPGEVAMVGDSLSTDIAGAKAAGSRAILVRTGKFDEEELGRSAVQPDLVVDSLAAVPGALLS